MYFWDRKHEPGEERNVEYVLNCNNQGEIKNLEGWEGVNFSNKAVSKNDDRFETKVIAELTSPCTKIL